jgi:hypothetical protein
MGCQVAIAILDAAARRQGQPADSQRSKAISQQRPAEVEKAIGKDHGRFSFAIAAFPHQVLLSGRPALSATHYHPHRREPHRMRRQYLLEILGRATAMLTSTRYLRKPRAATPATVACSACATPRWKIVENFRRGESADLAAARDDLKSMATHVARLKPTSLGVVMFGGTAASPLPSNCLIDEGNGPLMSLRWDMWAGHPCNQIRAIRAQSTSQEIFDRLLSLGLPRS